jgi:hypothetical protein
LAEPSFSWPSWLDWQAVTGMYGSTRDAQTYMSGWAAAYGPLAVQPPPDPQLGRRQRRVADMRPGDFFGGLFLSALFAVVIGLLTAVWIGVWFVTNVLNQPAPHF